MSGMQKQKTKLILKAVCLSQTAFFIEKNKFLNYPNIKNNLSW